jgi:glycosyltransferase involved in cell wall biosynthesis
VRIAFLADGSHPNGLRWAEYLAEIGETVAVFDFIDHPFRRNGVDHFPISSRFGGTKLRYLVAHRAARKDLLRWRPDILLGYRLVSFGFLAARTGVRPLVLAAQGQNLVPPGSSSYGGFCVRRALKAADLVHAWSPAMRDRMLEFGADPNKIIMCPRGIRLERYRSDQPRSSRPSMVSTRQLEPYYDQRTIIEAVAKLRDTIPDVELVLAGRGSDEQTLKEMVRRLDLGVNVRFAGFLDEDQVIRELERAWVYVSAVPTDGVSSSLLEAIACGCYPVVVDNQANRWWLSSGDQGALFPAADVDALATALRTALGSIDLRGRAKAANRAVVQSQADWQSNMRDFLSRYRRLVMSAESEASASGARGSIPGLGKSDES